VDIFLEKSQQIVMSDDGHGSSIRIPSIFISKIDGDIIIDYLIKKSKGQKVSGVIVFDETLK
jgi:hypothetical protein